MEYAIKGVDYAATKFEVQREIESVLHGPDLYDANDPKNKGRVPNFMVKLNQSQVGSEHDGTGALILSRRLGNRFHEWSRTPNNRILVRGHRLRFHRSPRKVSEEEKQILENAMYIGPEQEETRWQILQHTQQLLRIKKVQFGVWYRPPPAGGKIPNRIFSVEYERDCSQETAAYIEIEYEHKLMKIELGNRFTEDQCQFIIVKLTSINKIGIGEETGNPYIIFDMHVPPNLEEKSFNDRPREGFQRKKFKDRDRISALDEAHARVAPYAPHLRLVLYNHSDMKVFYDLCNIARCEPRPVRFDGIEANKRTYFADKHLYSINKWIRTLSWKGAFQIEALVRNGLLNTIDVLVDLRPHVEQLRKQLGSSSDEILRLYNAAMQLRHINESPVQCLQRVAADNTNIMPLVVPPGQFLCHHITFTPTRILLEGPYVTASNRVIRRYQKSYAPDLLENFVRVDFREEDRLSYRWDREVDGTYFLHQRVGSILKNGFELGGKYFEFLAYSTSALRSHAVWFISSFKDPDEGYVTAESIRRSLGDFTELLTTPSKYAARIAQAFTATDPSVTLVLGQWEEMSDIETELPSGQVSCHTDGVGTISPELGNEIWKMMCAASHDFRFQKRVQPSAYQIRFLGYKGVVVVDHRLEGIIMRLRPSQRKFRVHGVTEAPLEIARAFDYPNTAYLNKPVVAVLEDRGVCKEAFIDLQEAVKKNIYTACDSLPNFRHFLKSNSLGLKFHLPFIVEQLYVLGLDLTDRDDKRVLGSKLIGRLLRYGINGVLRDIKHRARIPVPKSYQLVGVADEGTAYVMEGHLKEQDVFTLKPGFIYACVQDGPDEEPVYLKGNCVISRSPVVHPGDVQRVFAVGAPPKDKVCFFAGLKNCVVLPTSGERSLASCLGGGDLDGDVFDIYIENPELLPVQGAEPAVYNSVIPRELPDGRTTTVDDICDFIVEYINSDVLGLLADRHLTIADQSKMGTFDPACIKLADMCSRAVDYAKHGNPTDLSREKLPRFLIPYKPDWHKAEVTHPHDNDYYVSDRALGHLYRGISLQDLDTPVDIPVINPSAPLSDPISEVLRPIVQEVVAAAPEDEMSKSNADLIIVVSSLFARYARELRYIRVTHTLTDTPGVKLAEEEVILGVILSTCTQKRWREDRVFKMKTHTDSLVRDVRFRLQGAIEEGDVSALRAAVRRAWVAWTWCQENREVEGSASFSLLVLGLLLDCLKKLDVLPDPEPAQDVEPEEDENWWVG